MRRTKLTDCNPHWVIFSGKEGDAPDAIYFDCPEGHEDCHYVIPFTPALNGSAIAVQQKNGVQWARAGDIFEKLTLTPSIRGLPSFKSKEAAIADGRIPEYVHPRMWCALHIFIRDGHIEFCGDSGPVTP